MRPGTRPKGYKDMTKQSKKLVDFLGKIRENIRIRWGDGLPTKTKGNDNMSNYSDSMVNEMTAHGAFTFADAQAYAEKHNLSTRSVVSKIKSLGLDYTPKPKAASKAGDRILKADTVSAIAKALDVNVESIDGLGKADARSLSALLMAIR
ncbi:MAG: hypothetical protein ACPHIB_02735 [Thalassobaculaceae bacterium]